MVAGPYGHRQSSSPWALPPPPRAPFHSRRRDELERGLKEIVGTDFSDVINFQSVIPGSTVELIVEGRKSETYHVLGLWDSVPEKNILSYDTPLGQLLLGKKVGENLSTPQNKDAQIKEIRKLPADVLEWAKTE